ncbi:MAG: hypothetical protein WBQ03_03530 [Candidatus Sulfotelmatobacter sp.]
MNRLLRDAAAVRLRLSLDGSASIEEVEQWSQWALAQGDRIDPAIGGKFSKAMQDEETIR